MNITPFPTLSPATIDAINVIGQWLAQDDFSGEVPYQADCVILAGNAVMPTIDAACKIARDQQIPLLISGGIGHSTTFLYSAIAQHPHYNTIRTTGRAEATILADIAHQFWHIPHEKIWIEDQSTNCGENARFSIALLNQAVGNDSNLLIVFYVQIMPDDFVMQLHRFENDSDFRPSRARCCLRFRLCRSIRCVYRLLITCSFPFRRDSYSGQPSVIHITTSKGDSRLIRRPSVAIVRSPNTCATTVFRRLSYA
ncbi:conserved SAM-binding protein, DUF218 family [Escherichia coli]|nr:conserved SAM-binding protein, DUF218 family [Escherichia coli]